MKAFTIAGGSSNGAWGPEIEKSIVVFLKNNPETEGLDLAVKEVYALNHNGKRALPHHEIRPDGRVVLSRAGLIAAAAGLQRIETEQRRDFPEARRHLVRHYKELQMKLPKGLTKETTVQGEIDLPIGQIVGEIDAIDVSPAVNVEELKKGDTDPMEVAVAVPVGKSKRGWNYTADSIKAIVDVTQKEGLPGFLGHQEQAKVDSEFRMPATIWVGAKFDPNFEIKDKAGKVLSKGAGLFRGIVDKSVPDLKRWIRSGVIKTVSIWGRPQLAKASGEVDVVGYDPFSLDWTPPRRAGMPTQIIAIGEMEEIMEEPAGEVQVMDPSLDGIRNALGQAVHERFPETFDKDGKLIQERPWVATAYKDYLIMDRGGKFFKVSYAITAPNNEITLGDPIEVIRKVEYIPKEGGTAMEKAKLIEEVKAAITAGTLTLAEISGEMHQAEAPAAPDLSPLREALGVSGEMDINGLAEKAKAFRAAADDKAKADHGKRVAQLIEDKVTGEMARILVKKQLNVPQDYSDDQIAGEISRILEDPDNKKVLGEMNRGATIPAGGQGGEAAPTGAHKSSTRIG